jgi:hypothetical protein
MRLKPGFGVQLLLVSLLVVFLLTGCYKPEPCRNEISSTALSPNGRLKAVVFRRICPYEQTEATNISILRADAELSDGNGNAFSYPDHTPTRVAWVRDDHLAVYTYGDLAKATKSEKLGPISIEYAVVMDTQLIGPIPGH